MRFGRGHSQARHPSPLKCHLLGIGFQKIVASSLAGAPTLRCVTRGTPLLRTPRRPVQRLEPITTTGLDSSPCSFQQLSIAASRIKSVLHKRRQRRVGPSCADRSISQRNAA